MAGAYAKKMALPTIVMIWAATYFAECQGYNLKSRRLVTLVFFIMLALYVINGVTDFMETRREWAAKSAEEKAAAAIDWKALRSGPAMRVAGIFAILVLYVLLLEPVGFVIVTFLSSLAILFVMGERSVVKLILIPVVLVALLYAAFKTGLRIPLPGGFLGL